MAESISVKICGITNYEDALLAAELGAFALGFNFYKKSPRYLSPEQAKEIIAQLPKKTWKVGVFVNASRDEITETADFAGLDMIQLHGNESLESCQGWGKYRVIKGVRVGKGAPDVEMQNYIDTVDHLLIDQYSPDAPGGTGEMVDDEFLRTLARQGMLKDAFLAGGLTPENVAAKVKLYQPYGIDVASGVESSPGKKDPALLKAFFAAISGL